MDSQKVDMFLISNGKLFDSHKIHEIREALLALDDSRWATLSAIRLNDPTVSLIISIVGGSLGIDRFVIGDVGLGVAKLLTCGGFGIWTIVDWFLIQQATRDSNLQKMQQFLYQ